VNGGGVINARLLIHQINFIVSAKDINTGPMWRYLMNPNEQTEREAEDIKLITQDGAVWHINKDDDDWYAIVFKGEFINFRNPVTDISLKDALKFDNCEFIGFTPIAEALQRAETRGREFTNIGEWANEHAKAYELGMLRAAEIVEGFFKNETRIDGGWQYNIAKAIRKEAQ